MEYQLHRLWMELLAADELREVRQVAMVDAQGRNDVYTGKRCMEAAGHVKGEGFSVQANMMLNDTIWPAMADAYRGCRGRPGRTFVGHSGGGPGCWRGCTRAAIRCHPDCANPKTGKFLGRKSDGITGRGSSPTHC